MHSISFVDIVYIIFCCLVFRDEEEGALRPADADKNLNIDMKNWQLEAQCSVAYAQAHSSAVYLNKKVA